MGSPHETDNIVRFGRDAERCSKEGVENRQSRVYPTLMSAIPPFHVNIESFSLFLDVCAETLQTLS